VTENVEISPQPELPTTSGAQLRARTWNLTRVLAAIAGIAMLITVSVFSLGLALLAPVGMIVARTFSRREKTPLTFFTSWLGAAFGVCAALIVVALVVVAVLPSGTIAGIGKMADSVSTASSKQPPPAWLEKIAPGSTARARASQPSANSPMVRTFTVASQVMGVVVVYSLLAMFIGTAGWVPSLLLTYAFSGRWLPAS
jgi:fatty acid desaturase